MVVLKISTIIAVCLVSFFVGYCLGIIEKHKGKK